MNCRLQKLEELIIAFSAKLVIIDSIASVVRKEYDSTISHNMAERSCFLARVAAILKHTAEALLIPVCVFCLMVILSFLAGFNVFFAYFQSCKHFVCCQISMSTFVSFKLCIIFVVCLVYLQKQIVTTNQIKSVISQTRGNGPNTSG